MINRERFWVLFCLSWMKVVVVCDFAAIFVFDFHTQARFIFVLTDLQSFWYQDDNAWSCMIVLCRGMCNFMVIFMFDFHSYTRFIVTLTDWQGFLCQGVTAWLMYLTINVSFMFCMHVRHRGWCMYYLTMILGYSTRLYLIASSSGRPFLPPWYWFLATLILKWSQRISPKGKEEWNL